MSFNRIYVWSGPSSGGGFNDFHNWSPVFSDEQPPSDNDLTIFNTGGIIVVDGQNGLVAEIDVVLGTTLIVTNSLEGSGVATGVALVADSGGIVIVGSGAEMVGIGAFDVIGFNGSGELDVLAGGSLDASGMSLGDRIDGSGTVVVNGGGAIAVIDGTLSVGNVGTGTLTVENGGSLGSLFSILGVSAGAVGAVEVDASAVTLGAFTTVGEAGSGSVDIKNGGAVFSGFTELGGQTDASGTVTVTGADWTAGTLTIGQSGSGSIDVQSGGSLDVFGISLLGAIDGSIGAATLDDAQWTTGALTVGQAGKGSVAVQNGGLLTTGVLSIGATGSLGVFGVVGGVGTVAVSGSIVTLGGGTLDVSNGGVFAEGAGTGPTGTALVETGATFIGVGTLNGKVALHSQAILQATGVAPAGLTVNGDITGTGTVEPLMILDLNGAVAPGIAIVFTAPTLLEQGVLVLEDPEGEGGTISGFTQGNTIELPGRNFDHAVFSPGTLSNPGTLILSGGTEVPLELAVAGGYAAGDFLATPDAFGVAVTLGLCFVKGTMIATGSGEKPVERLAAGDMVITAGGEARAIVWIGVGRVMVARGRRSAPTPVIVRKGALGDNVPNRDLHVTKGHSLYLDGVLVPVEFLINHRSILWDDAAQEVEIYHVELASHDVLLANGAPAESYRDDGNRWLFQNANSGWGRPVPPPYAPVLTGGPLVDALWRRLLDRAGGRPGVPLTDDPDLHLMIDGIRNDPAHEIGDARIFRLSKRPGTVSVVSRAGIPTELGFARDARLLGVAVRSIVLRQAARFHVITAADSRLCNGFHAFEPEQGLRWTDGDAALPIDPFGAFDGAFELVLHLAGSTRYPLFDDPRATHAA